MGGYEAARWADFAVGVAGATAALAGLLFVAVSVNIQRIMQFAYLPARAGQTLIMLITPRLCRSSFLSQASHGTCSARSSSASA